MLRRARVGAGNLLDVEVDERILLGKRFDGGFNGRRFHFGQDPKLSLLLGLGDDLVAAFVKNITFGLGIFFRFKDALAWRCRQNRKAKEP